MATTTEDRQKVLWAASLDPILWAIYRSRMLAIALIVLNIFWGMTQPHYHIQTAFIGLVLYLCGFFTSMLFSHSYLYVGNADGLYLCSRGVGNGSTKIGGSITAIRYTSILEMISYKMHNNTCACIIYVAAESGNAPVNNKINFRDEEVILNDGLYIYGEQTDAEENSDGVQILNLLKFLFFLPITGSATVFDMDYNRSKFRYVVCCRHEVIKAIENLVSKTSRPEDRATCDDL
jgi:hypothetical protein